MGGARFEYRIWGRGADGVAEQIAERGQPSGEKTGSDTYLLVPGDPSIGIKIRSGRLQVKRRLEIRAGLERWTALLSEAFPVPASVFPPDFARLLGNGDRAIPSAESLLREMRSRSAGARAVRVLKHRLFYDVEGCRTEFDRIQVSGSTLHSVGLDDADAEKLHDTLRLLGADRFRNLGYPEKLLSLSDE